MNAGGNGGRQGTKALVQGRGESSTDFRQRVEAQRLFQSYRQWTASEGGMQRSFYHVHEQHSAAWARASSWTGATMEWTAQVRGADGRMIATWHSLGRGISLPMTS